MPSRTERFEWADAERIAALEPDLAGRFRRALFFPDEAHLDPRRALASLAETLKGRGVAIRFGVELDPKSADADIVVDCRGLAARDALPDLRGVRGEMIVVRTSDVSLARPVRMLHPRLPLYIVPRGDGLFMIGATMIESERRGPVSVRSAVELLNAAYALHPAFGEAEIVELGADLRPAFPDNLPHMRRAGRVLHANGLFRHGFLLAPSLPAGWRMPSSILHSSRRQKMRIFLNDDAHDVEPGTLAAALESLGFGGRKIATAVNGRFVAAAARPEDRARRWRSGRGRGADAGRLGARRLDDVLRRRTSLAPAAGHGALSVARGSRARHQGVGRRGRDGLAAPRGRQRPQPGKASGRSSSRSACACCPTRRAAIRSRKP